MTRLTTFLLLIVISIQIFSIFQTGAITNRLSKEVQYMHGFGTHTTDNRATIHTIEYKLLGLEDRMKQVQSSFSYIIGNQ